MGFMAKYVKDWNLVQKTTHHAQKMDEMVGDVIENGQSVVENYLEARKIFRKFYKIIPSASNNLPNDPNEEKNKNP